MTYREISIYTTTAGIDIVSGYLTMQGIRGVVIEDSADFGDFLTNTEIHWDYVDESLMQKQSAETNVKFYLPDNLQGIETYNQLAGGLERLREENPAVDLGRLAVTVTRVDEEDWSTAWKKYYHPVKVGNRLVIIPRWENYPLTEREIGIRLDPGMAFGTGTHETTRLCLRLLEDSVFPGTEMLDIGTGSGILAIAALLLGADRATGVDIDELAVKVAGENAALNGVQEGLSLFCGDLTEKVTGQFDVVCANIVADVILRLAGNVGPFLKENGVLLVSGIIEERCEEVKAALQSAGFLPEETLSENGWAAIRLSKGGRNK